MNKVFISLVVAFILSACTAQADWAINSVDDGKEFGSSDRQGRFTPNAKFNEYARDIARSPYYAVERFVDPETGCHYLIYDGQSAGGMTARMSVDGKQICTPEAVE